MQFIVIAALAVVCLDRPTVPGKSAPLEASRNIREIAIGPRGIAVTVPEYWVDPFRKYDIKPKTSGLEPNSFVLDRSTLETPGRPVTGPRKWKHPFAQLCNAVVPLSECAFEAGCWGYDFLSPKDFAGRYGGVWMRAYVSKAEPEAIKKKIDAEGLQVARRWADRESGEADPGGLLTRWDIPGKPHRSIFRMKLREFSEQASVEFRILDIDGTSVVLAFLYHDPKRGKNIADEITSSVRAISYGPRRHGVYDDGHVTVLPDRVALEVREDWQRYLTKPELDHAHEGDGEWDYEYAWVVNSVLPFRSCGAHFGTEPWGPEATSFGDLQMRVYVLDEEKDFILARIKKDGRAAAERFGTEVKLAETPDVAWHRARLSYDLWFFDYGGTAHVDFALRSYGPQTVAVVSMFAMPKHEETVDAMLRTLSKGK